MDYQYLTSRIESFSPSKQKRPKASSSKQSLKWPHPSSFKATPDSLAEAGFYYNPGSDSPDCATCYMCNKSIDGWEPEDDPFAIHYEKCQETCAWAVVRCQSAMGEKSYRFTDPARHPASKTMEKARLETFSKSKWPHDAVKGHGANSKALAKAGFVCSSDSPGDDTAICLYCNLSLGGWDEDDDPYEEHVKRKLKKCSFLKAATEESLLGQSTAKRPASKTAPKPLSRSVSQNLRNAPPPPPPEELSEDELISSELSPPPKTSSSRARGTPVKTPASRRSTRGTTKTPASRTVSSEVEDDDAGKRSSKGKRKTGAIAEEADEEMEVDGLEAEPQEKKKRGKPPASKARMKKAQMQEEEVDVVEDSDVEPVPPPAKKSRSRSRSKVVQDPEVESIAAPAPKSSHTRTKSTSKAKAKPKPDEIEEIAPPPAATSKKNGKQPANTAPSDDDVVSAPPRKLKGKALPRTKAKPVEGSDEEVREERPRQRPQGAQSTTSQQRQPSAERKSSLSEDAGYATAEPAPEPDQMDVDDNSRPPAPLPKSKAKASARPTSGGVVEKSTAAKRPPSAANGESSRASTSRPPSKVSKNSLQVVEIETEGEDASENEVRPKSRSKGKAPETATGKTDKVTHKPAEKTTISVPKIPPPEQEDEPMEDTRHSNARDSGASAAPGTPVSAVHRSAHPSPVRPDDDEDDVFMDARETMASTASAKAPYHPFLAEFPAEELSHLTEEEANMTIEQYIRHEMERQYVQLKTDGERRIEEFKRKAVETRKVIEAS
ncbi:uncharacterized protein BXZ73DRAFT_88456 [Epithele typhae]|uniref:uncharacterized protein n=1 Tax=Epithele typhae TaxID=378194 RepID=UPI0020071DF6|nr:uncharacterized protein BXZ73DRAFT_88456 [Epithele typhae]KAH9941315.1 hypothetical protein BXZ73DRAFT_88456 [Epithele typhae]